MNPTPALEPPNDPEPQNPVPPPEPQPESTHSKIFAAQFQPPKSKTSKSTATAKSPAVTNSSPLPSAFDLFKPSWEAVQRNFNSFIWLVLGPSLFAGVGEVITRHLHHQQHGIGNLLSIIGTIYSIVVLAAVPLLALRAAKGQTTEPLSILNDSWRFFWRLLGLYIVIAVLVIVGLILLIVPGLIMMRRYFLAPYFLVDQDLGISEAMNLSAAATKGRSMAVFGIIGVEILLALTGIIPFVGPVIAVFAELPYTCAPALRYFQLKEQTGKTAA